MRRSSNTRPPPRLKEALALLAARRRKILAGGMSLIPMMKLRLAAPEDVVDLSRVPGLSGITEIGRHRPHRRDDDASRDRGFAGLRGRCPLLAETAGKIGDVQVRNMGTIGGSVAHADPAADYPAALLALEARSAAGLG